MAVFLLRRDAKGDAGRSIITYYMPDWRSAGFTFLHGVLKFGELIDKFIR